MFVGISVLEVRKANEDGEGEMDMEPENFTKITIPNFLGMVRDLPRCSVSLPLPYNPEHVDDLPKPILKQRKEFWLSFLALTFLATVVIGTLTLTIGVAWRRDRGVAYGQGSPAIAYHRQPPTDGPL